MQKHLIPSKRILAEVSLACMPLMVINDGEVFSGDLAVLLNEYPTFGGYNAADFDLDGEVFSGDLGFLLNNYPTFTSIP